MKRWSGLKVLTRKALDESGAAGMPAQTAKPGLIRQSKTEVKG
jgi:hypothetical protein